MWDKSFWEWIQKASMTQALGATETNKMRVQLMSGMQPVRPRWSLLLAVITAALLAGSAAAAQSPASSPQDQSAAGPSAMMNAMDKMNKGMASAPMTGNVDHDFVAMMIPHHQGAIDMAKLELASGKDPTLRNLAHNIISAQESEIKMMKQWQAKHPQ
jgi:uncharacterized protein (DUF305 family)